MKDKDMNKKEYLEFKEKLYKFAREQYDIDYDLSPLGTMDLLIERVISTNKVYDKAIEEKNSKLRILQDNLDFALETIKMKDLKIKELKAQIDSFKKLIETERRPDLEKLFNLKNEF